MTVAELREELAKYPDDMTVVYDVFLKGPDLWNYIEGAYIHKDEYGYEYLHLYED